MTCRVKIEVLSYDEGSDEFDVRLDMPEAPCGGYSLPRRVESVALACMLRTWGEPHELLGVHVVEF